MKEKGGDLYAMELSGKKLLVLCGGAFEVEVVKLAKSMGLFTVVTDWNTDWDMSPAKQMADEVWDISWSDIDALENKCRKRGIDGVFAGFSEFRTSSAQKLCERLGKPFFATSEQIGLTRNKLKFKDVCRQYGVPVVEQYELDERLLANHLEKLLYPVIVKPADNMGSRGLTICRFQSEIRDAYSVALSFSATKSVIVERYMAGEEVNFDYTIQDGYVSLSCAEDMFESPTQKGNAPIPNAEMYPSKHLPAYMKKVDAKVRDMVRGLGIRNGILIITAFVDKNGDFFIFEAGFRVGTLAYNLIAKNNQVNYLEMTLRHTITGYMGGPDLQQNDDPYFKYPGCCLSILLKRGKIMTISGVEVIKSIPEVLCFVQILNENMVVDKLGMTHQTLGKCALAAENKDALVAAIDKVYDTIQVLDEHGESMLLDRLDTSLLDRWWQAYLQEKSKHETV